MSIWEVIGFFFTVFWIVLMLDIITSVSGKSYVKYSDPNDLVEGKAWFHHKWKYLGGKCGHPGETYWHIGVRWFGHEWEKKVRIRPKPTAD